MTADVIILVVRGEVWSCNKAVRSCIRASDCAFVAIPVADAEAFVTDGMSTMLLLMSFVVAAVAGVVLVPMTLRDARGTDD